MTDDPARQRAGGCTVGPERTDAVFAAAVGSNYRAGYRRSELVAAANRPREPDARAVFRGAARGAHPVSWLRTDPRLHQEGARGPADQAGVCAAGRNVGDFRRRIAEAGGQI